MKEERNKPGRKPLNGSLYSVMREMDEGDKLIIPIDRLQHAASTASRLKKEFGVLFRVRKMLTSRGNDKWAIVFRLKMGAKDSQ